MITPIRKGKIMKCLKCGANLRKNDVFCPECGTKIEPKIKTECGTLYRKIIGKKKIIIFLVIFSLVALWSMFSYLLVPEEMKKIDIDTVNIYDLKIDIDKNFKYDRIILDSYQIEENADRETAIEESFEGDIINLNADSIGAIAIAHSNNIQFTKNKYIDGISEVADSNIEVIINGHPVNKYYSKFGSVFYFFSIKDYFFIVAMNHVSNEYYAQKITEDYTNKYN